MEGGRAPRNPEKRVKLPSLAILPVSFLTKTNQIVTQTNNAPSMVLAVLDLGKIAKESLSGPEGPGTVKIGMPSKKNSYKTSVRPHGLNKK